MTPAYYATVLPPTQCLPARLLPTEDPDDLERDGDPTADVDAEARESMFTTESRPFDPQLVAR